MKLKSDGSKHHQLTVKQTTTNKMDFALNQIATHCGWSAEYANQVLTEFHRFMIIRAEYGDTCSPCDEVDLLWHQVLLDTRLYQEYCIGLGSGQIVHHDPKAALDQSARQTRLGCTLFVYQEKFGTNPPAEVWQDQSLWLPTCAICFDRILQTATLACCKSADFCNKCLKKLTQCPNCRAKDRFCVMREVTIVCACSETLSETKNVLIHNQMTVQQVKQLAVDGHSDWDLYCLGVRFPDNVKLTASLLSCTEFHLRPKRKWTQLHLSKPDTELVNRLALETEHISVTIVVTHQTEKQSFPVAVRPTTTVFMLKAQFLKHIKEDFALVHKGQPMEDHHALQRYGVSHGDMLFVQERENTSNASASTDDPFPLEFRYLNGGSVSLNMRPSYTVDKIKKMILPREPYKLIYMGQIMEDHRTLQSYGVSRGDFVVVILREEPPAQTDVSQSEIDSLIFDPLLARLHYWSNDRNEPAQTNDVITFFVKLRTGKSIVIKMGPNQTVDVLKHKIHDKDAEHTPCSLRLIFAGKQLEDGRTLAQYNIQTNSTVHCVVRMGGC